MQSPVWYSCPCTVFPERPALHHLLDDSEYVLSAEFATRKEQKDRNYTMASSVKYMTDLQNAEERSSTSDVS